MQHSVAWREGGIDAVRGDDDLLVRDVVELAEVAARPLGDGEHADCLPRRARDDLLEDEPVLAAHQRRLALEGEVVDRDDRGARQRERQRVLEVTERRAELPEQARQRHGHAAAPGTASRDARPRFPRGRGSGSRVTAAIRSPAAGASGASSRRRLSTYVSSPVRSRPRTSASTTTSGVTRAPARRLRRDRRPTPTCSCAPARARAGAARRAAQSASSIPAAIASTSSGSTSTAAPPATSSVAPPRLVTTGAPDAIASRTGMPKPSYSEGKTSARAPR